MFLFSSPACVAVLACCWDREQWRRVSWKPVDGPSKTQLGILPSASKTAAVSRFHCLRHLIVLNSDRGVCVCIALIYSKLVTGVRKGRSLGLDMPPTPRGRNHCLSEAILKSYFRCGFHDGNNFTPVEAIPVMCDSTWWPQHLPSPVPPALLQLTASLLAALLVCHTQDKVLVWLINPLSLPCSSWYGS